MAAASILATPLVPQEGFSQTPPPASLPVAVASYFPIPVSFGLVPITSPETTFVTVRNLGEAELAFTSITSTNPAVFSVGSFSPTVPAGGSQDVQITFAPDVAGPHSGQLVFVTNDAFNPEFRLDLAGEGVDVNITLDPSHSLLLPSQTVSLQALVTGTSDKGVTWSLQGGGTITQGGVYTAPTTPGTATVLATSTVDPNVSGSATILIYPPNTAEGPGDLLGAGHFGSALVTTDLDGDGFLEVFVGAPESPVSGVTGAGQIWWQTFDGNGFAGTAKNFGSQLSQSPTTGGGFASAIAAADVNGDGLKDLVIGEPGGGVAGGGAIEVWIGDGAGGFDPPLSIEAPGAAAGDQFGAAVAVGPFGADTAPRVAVGAPGRTVSGLSAAGTVDILVWQGGTLSFETSTPITAPLPQAGAGFGTALAVACLDDCSAYGLPEEAYQRNDLLVGAPGASVQKADGTVLSGAGRIYAHLATGTAGGPLFSSAIEVHSPVPAAGAEFGYALATGDANGDTFDDLAAGAPGQPDYDGVAMVPAGAAFLFLSDSHGYLQFVNRLPNPSPVNGGRFGTAVLVQAVDDDLFADVTVGAINPSSSGEVFTYYESANGEPLQMRRFSEPVPESGALYGASLARADLNGDGISDLLVGAPMSAAGGTAGEGTIHVHLDKPPNPLTVTPTSVSAARIGGRSSTIQFTGSAPQDQTTWNVIGPGGTIDTAGLFTTSSTAPPGTGNTATVRMRDTRRPNHWALAHVRLTDRTAMLVSPELIPNGDGTYTLGLPEEGLHFGSTVTIAQLGRAPTDPSRDRQTVLGGFPAVIADRAPQLNRYTYDDNPARTGVDIKPFPSIEFMPGSPGDAGSAWGAQVEHGDFNGDGNQDLAIAAPFAHSVDGSQPQVGFLDIHLMDAVGEVTSIIELAPSVSMLKPDGTPLWTATNTQANSRYGYRVKAADLNGDGRDDLIVGVPHAEVDGIRDAGIVEVLLAPSSGDWLQGITRATLVEPVPRPGGYFGSALAVGNTTGSGAPELFIGAPGRDPEELETLLRASGKVYGIKPADWNQPDNASLRAALAAAQRIEITDPAPDPTGYYSGFGLSLAVGNLSSDDPADELAVGAPFRVYVDPRIRDYLQAPYYRQMGSVELFDGGAGFTVQAIRRIFPPFRQIGMRFGHTLATGHYSPDVPGGDSLLVGAPYTDTAYGADGGAVFAYGNPAPGSLIFREMLLPFSGRPADFFGLSLASGDLDYDGIDELAVGAPNTSISILTGYAFYPGTIFNPPRSEPIIETRKQAGAAYVIFQGQW